jgi:hypothetical protein
MAITQTSLPESAARIGPMVEVEVTEQAYRALLSLLYDSIIVSSACPRAM